MVIPGAYPTLPDEVQLICYYPHIGMEHHPLLEPLVIRIIPLWMAEAA
jgi:hypothetical protein